MAYLSSGKGSLFSTYTPNFRLANMRIGKDVGHSFHTSKSQCHIGRTPKNLYSNGLLCFTEARGMRKKAGIPQNQRKCHIDREGLDLKIFGEDGEETLNSSAKLAAAYRLEGRLKEAEQLELQVLETHKVKLGAGHPGITQELQISQRRCRSRDCRGRPRRSLYRS